MRELGGIRVSIYGHSAVILALFPLFWSFFNCPTDAMQPPEQSGVGTSQQAQQSQAQTPTQAQGRSLDGSPAIVPNPSTSIGSHRNEFSSVPAGQSPLATSNVPPPSTTRIETFERVLIELKTFRAVESTSTTATPTASDRDVPRTVRRAFARPRPDRSILGGARRPARDCRG